ncbi:unnamed protein product [Dimorphilus gyrociliatus]|uniref:Uncharacterized protein n=1 Tax=Dimorphilus gyrociliatus TaxID=2664684 RepID=A0A7I8VPY3_9ANNE|nr:unnamed protein product [Dimorphilus gyrociliatus]
MTHAMKKESKLRKIKKKLGATYKINRLIRSILKNTTGLGGTKIRFSKKVIPMFTDSGRDLLEKIAFNLKEMSKDEENLNLNNANIEYSCMNEDLYRAIKLTRQEYPLL